MTISKLLLIITILFTSLQSQARNWKRVYIPDTYCGNGDQYSVFVEIKNPKKLAVEFMGGGACWDRSSCKGPNLRTILFPIPRIPVLSAFSSDFNDFSPVKDYSAVYFPYCTGDVFAGDHVAKYRSSFFTQKVHHKGYSNVTKTIEYLKKEVINFSKVDDFVLYGASAGAIGSLIHAHQFDKVLNLKAKRSMIADSPGLHFGKTFWNKFPPKLLMDFDQAFSNANFNIDFNDGLVAENVPAYCDYLSHWNIGVVQSSKDIIMSSVFGNISPEEHKKLVFGKRGLLEMVKGIPNCSAFIPESKMHTFLLLVTSSLMEIKKTTVMDYAREVMEGKNTTYAEL